jgi:hypothetical protein
MAIIRKLQPRPLEKDSRHTETDGTYSLLTDSEGSKVLQIDSYGSEHRRYPDKVSQSMRFSKEALEQLKSILREHFP